MTGKSRIQRLIFTPNRRTAVLAVQLAAGIGIVFLTVQRHSPAEWRRAAEGGEGVTVMSFNILMGGRPPSAAIDAIEAARPDIVCLQEMTPGLADMFKVRLGKRFPHRYFKPGGMTQGVGIASRYPLSDGKVLTLGLTYLPAVSATVRLKSGAVRVACVHLMPPLARFKKSVNVWKRYYRNEGIRVGQAGRLLDHLNAAGLPAIILGDMNEWPGQAALSRLTAQGFTNACAGRGPACGPTWPGPVMYFPALFRVDHIMGRGVRFTDAAVLEAGGSDHYPVLARFVLSR